MGIDEKAYELHILKKAINTCIDENLPLTEDGLNILIHQSDELVWEVAKKIYTQSGYKVEFSLIRDIIISRIEPLKTHLMDKKVEEERRKVAWIAGQKAAEEKRRAEEHRRAALLAAQKAEEEALKQEQLNTLGDQLEASGRNRNMAALFSKIRGMVGEQLSVDSADVKLEASFANDLGADELDIPQLVMAFEDEFDLEIPDCDSETLSIVGNFVDYIYEQLQLKD